MKHGSFVAFLAAAALALGALVLVRPWSRAERPPLSPLAVIPAGPAFVLHVDLERLRKSATGAQLSKLGLDRLAVTHASAAFQPLRDVDEVVLAVPGSARLAREGASVFEPDAVALVAVGRFTGRAVADAAFERIRERHGEPVRTRLGSFESVRNLRGGGEVAARDRLVIVSDGAYLRAVLAAADGHRAAGNEAEDTRDRVHAELRRTFGQGAPVTATLTLPEGWLESALRDPDVRRSPLALVRSAIVRVNVADSLDIHALCVCATADDCSHVRRFLHEAREDLASALGPNPPRIEIAPPRDGRVEFSFALSTNELERALAPRDADD